QSPEVPIGIGPRGWRGTQRFVEQVPHFVVLALLGKGGRRAHRFVGPRPPARPRPWDSCSCLEEENTPTGLWSAAATTALRRRRSTSGDGEPGFGSLTTRETFGRGRLADGSAEPHRRCDLVDRTEFGV